MRILVRATCICATVCSLFALAYSLYGYALFGQVNKDSEQLFDYVNKYTQNYTVKGIGNYGEHIVTTNPVIDSINSILEPYTHTGAVDEYTFDHNRIHKSENRFSVEELAVLSENGFLSKILPNNKSYKLKEVEYLYGSRPFSYPDFLQNKASGEAFLSLLVFAGWIFISIIAFKGTAFEAFSNDYLFIRYKWANESSLIGRKLMSLLFNSILIAGLFLTVLLPFSLNHYEYSSSDYDQLVVLLSLDAFTLFALWSLTSIGWWIFGKKQFVT